jgi:hypothetical protein
MPIMPELEANKSVSPGRIHALDDKLAHEQLNTLKLKVHR